MVTKVALALTLLVAIAFADINEDYKHIIHGQVQLTDQDIDKIYGQFLREFKDSTTNEDDA